MILILAVNCMITFCSEICAAENNREQITQCGIEVMGEEPMTPFCCHCGDDLEDTCITPQCFSCLNQRWKYTATGHTVPLGRNQFPVPPIYTAVSFQHVPDPER